MVGFLKSAKATLASTGAGAGTGNVDGEVLDMEGFDAVLFIAHFSTGTANGVGGIRPLVGSASGSMNAATTAYQVTYTSTGEGNGQSILLDVERVGDYRYIQPRVTRATQNLTVGSVHAMQYNRLKSPTTSHGTDIKAFKSVTDPTT